MKKLLDYQQNPVVFIITYNWRQLNKFYKCLTSKDYNPDKFYW